MIGGGIAGLAAAWRLREHDVLLLEAGDRLGGRMRSDARGEYWLNHGAHLFPAPGTIVDRMARDCGLRDRAGDRQHDGTRAGLHAADPRSGRDLSVPSAAVPARPGRVRGRGPARPARRGRLPPRVLSQGGRDAGRRAGACPRVRGRPVVRGAPRPVATGGRGDLLLRRSPRHGGAVRALRRLRPRALRARVGRPQVAHRPEPRSAAPAAYRPRWATRSVRAPGPGAASPRCARTAPTSSSTISTTAAR